MGHVVEAEGEIKGQQLTQSLKENRPAKNDGCALGDASGPPE
jgi:hypothetical protein